MSVDSLSEVDYHGKKIAYSEPLGIYLDGRTTGRVHDSIAPKYRSLDAQRLAGLDVEWIRTIHTDSIRQLRDIACHDSAEVKHSLENTRDFTRALLSDL